MPMSSPSRNEVQRVVREAILAILPDEKCLRRQR